jgi:hypothetical protein
VWWEIIERDDGRILVAYKVAGGGLRGRLVGDDLPGTLPPEEYHSTLVT